MSKTTEGGNDTVSVVATIRNEGTAMNTRCCSNEVHEGIKADASAWGALPCIGRMPSGEDGVMLELRNCVCGSTLAVEIADDDFSGPEEPTRPLAYQHVSADTFERLAMAVRS